MNHKSPNNAASSEPRPTPEPDRLEIVSGRRGLWRPLERTDAVGFWITLVIAATVTLPKVIWQPCFVDPGEVQLAAAVGGIGHPPGQDGIITIFRCLCVVLPFEPHLSVSGANALFALATIAVLTLGQLRTGANPVAAGICSLLFLADD